MDALYNPQIWVTVGWAQMWLGKLGNNFDAYNWMESHVFGCLHMRKRPPLCFLSETCHMDTRIEGLTDMNTTSSQLYKTQL
jgi:hypothetical protein